MTFSDFFDRINNLDWLAVVVGALVFMVVGFLWYGPLFGKAWSKATGVAMTGGMPRPDKMGWTFVYSFVLSSAVNYFGVLDKIEHSLIVGIMLGFFVAGAAAYSQVVWENRKHSVWMIDTIYLFVAISIVAYVQGLMA
ncbi:MAG: hypothetical protein A2Z12_05715 [Actinobacteria bacterium RBG_16_68_21]|nr:MAG: hypothetical protein A2Z12_05715 [Actinobacteria bacterium RBG_16_68_21]